MKSRVTTYVLMVAAVAVWGIIAKKIFFSKPADAVADTRRPPRQAEKAPEEILLLDYKDPFLKNTAPATVAKTSANPVRRANTPAAVPKKPAPPKETPPMKYTGSIKAATRTVYLFEQGGIQHSLPVGGTLNDYTLIGAWPDSVRLQKNEESFTLGIQP